MPFCFAAHTERPHVCVWGGGANGIKEHTHLAFDSPPLLDYTVIERQFSDTYMAGEDWSIQQ